MTTLTSSEITSLLIEWSNGSSNALEQLFPLVEGHLRKIARNRLKSNSDLPEMDTVALVGDLYIRLTNDKSMEMSNRSQFFKAAAVIMRHIVVDHARAYRAQKRGVDRIVAPPTDGLDSLTADKLSQTEELLAINDALYKLEQNDPDDCKLVELKYFLGLTNTEIAAVMNVSERTVRRNLITVKAWLGREIGR